MISTFSISSFKSLVGLTVNFSPKLNILIGLNSSGKTTLLQAVSFVCGMTQSGGSKSWLDKRGWVKQDLINKATPQEKTREIGFSISGTHDAFEYLFDGKLAISSLKCSFEEATVTNNGVLRNVKCEGGIITIGTEGPLKMDLGKIDYTGSIMSALRYDPPEPLGLRVIFSHVVSLELLSPNKIRTRVRDDDDSSIGSEGERVSLVLHKMKPDQRASLHEIMKRFYPHFARFETKKIQGGGKKLFICEYFDNGAEIKSEARHISDGMLRVLAIITQTLMTNGTILIDEIEDGLNPELLEGLTQYLLSDECPAQIIATTHSPSLVNFLTDDQAKSSVKLVYKDATGQSHVCSFFDIPSVARELESLNPGEVMLAVELSSVAQEAQRIKG